MGVMPQKGKRSFNFSYNGVPDATCKVVVGRAEARIALMIAQPKLSMQAVADSCGFSSRRLFYQVFTRETGLTPSQWRDSQGGEVNG